MDLDAIRQLVQLMKDNQICELDWESEGQHIRLKAAAGAPPAPVHAPPVALPAEAGIPEPPTPEPIGEMIVSPLVGTIFHAPGPDKPPFVQVGDEVEESTVVCIIEAMKVMNEIKAERRGRISKVLVENGQPVEFGQALFMLEPTP